MNINTSEYYREHINKLKDINKLLSCIKLYSDDSIIEYTNTRRAMEAYNKSEKEGVCRERPDLDDAFNMIYTGYRKLSEACSRTNIFDTSSIEFKVRNLYENIETAKVFSQLSPDERLGTYLSLELYSLADGMNIVTSNDYIKQHITNKLAEMIVDKEDYIALKLVDMLIDTYDKINNNVLDKLDVEDSVYSYIYTLLKCEDLFRIRRYIENGNKRYISLDDVNNDIKVEMGKLKDSIDCFFLDYEETIGNYLGGPYAHLVRFVSASYKLSVDIANRDSAYYKILSDLIRDLKGVIDYEFL